MEKQKRPVKKSLVYDNCAMYSPSGEFMAYVPLRRMNWYLKREIAKKLDEKAFQITFEPKGNGDANDRGHCIRENKCVVCGVEENLTLHHIVPYCYRKHLPLEYKNRNCFDVVCLCHKCHDEYERIAIEKKKELCKQLNVSEHRQGTPEQAKAVKNLSLIGTLVRYREKIPKERILEILNTLSEGLNEKVTLDNLEHISGKHSEKLERVAKFEDNDLARRVLKAYLKQSAVLDFIVLWREHFLENAQPKHIDEGWLEFYKTRER